MSVSARAHIDLKRGDIQDHAIADAVQYIQQASQDDGRQQLDGLDNAGRYSLTGSDLAGSSSRVVHLLP